MKLNKKITALLVAMTITASMMSVNVSAASKPYNWTIKKSYGQPTSTVKCEGEVTQLTAAADDAIDFTCSSVSNSYATVKFDIEEEFKKVQSQYAYVHYAGDTDSIKFKAYWYSDSDCEDGNCSVYGTLMNDTSTTFTASGTAR